MSSYVSRLFSLVNRGILGKNRGLSTGLPKLDNILYGIQRRHMTIIGGPTAGGKTLLALYSYVFRPLMEVSSGKVKDIWILYFSFEISGEVLLAKLLSMYIYETFGKIITYEEVLSLKKPLTDEGLSYISASRDWLEMVEDHIAIIDKPLAANEIDAAIRQFAEQFGRFETLSDTQELYHPNNPEQYLISILDHLALINSRPLKNGIDEAVKSFIYYRNIASFTCILLQQLNRNMQNMDRRNSNYNTPDLADFQDSSGTVQGAEAVVAIYDAYREKQKECLKYDIEELKDRFRALSILKNRIGLSNKIIGVSFYGEVGVWKELPKAEEIKDYNKYNHLDGERLIYNTDMNILPDENMLM